MPGKSELRVGLDTCFAATRIPASSGERSASAPQRGSPAGLTPCRGGTS